MKWRNFWIKNFADYIYTKNCLQFNTTTVILHKSKKYQGVKEKKHDLKMSMSSCWLYKPVSDWLKMLPLDITTVNM